MYIILYTLQVILPPFYFIISYILELKKISKNRQKEERSICARVNRACKDRIDICAIIHGIPWHPHLGCRPLIHATSSREELLRRCSTHAREKKRNRLTTSLPHSGRLKLGDDAHPSSLRSNTRRQTTWHQTGAAPVRDGCGRKYPERCYVT